MSLPLPVTTPSEKHASFGTTRQPVELVVAVRVPDGEGNTALRELPTPAPLRGYRLTRLVSYEEVDSERGGRVRALPRSSTCQPLNMICRRLGNCRCAIAFLLSSP